MNLDNFLRPRVFIPTLVVGVLALLGVVLLVTGAGPRASASHSVAPQASPAPSPSPSPSPPEPPPPPPPPPDPNPILATATVADAAVGSVPVYASPAAGPVVNRIAGSNSEGQPEAFLVVDQATPGWFQVELPVKPNGSLGWIQKSTVKTRTITHYLRVSQSDFRLEHYVNGQLVHTFRVALGAPSTPTPNGKFFVWATQVWGEAPYTPGIFALSGFSPVLENWPGGGRVGIHGWTDSRVMGTRASHGCVRVATADFAKLLNSVPLGTPVDILP